MADFENATAFARYAEFSVGRDSVNPEEDGYPLTVDQYSGTAGKNKSTTAAVRPQYRKALHSTKRCWSDLQVTPS